MRLIANFHKGEALRFVSHLDVQRLLHRAMRRAHIPVAYSQGFNPHPLLSCASALSLGYTSDGEWLDVRLLKDMAPEDFANAMNEALPPGLCIRSARPIGEQEKTLTALLQAAHYRVELTFEAPIEKEALQSAVDTLLSGPILVEKRTKGGMKQVDLRPQLIGLRIVKAENTICVLEMHSVLNADGGLKVSLLLEKLCDLVGVKALARAPGISASALCLCRPYKRILYCFGCLCTK